MLKRHIFRLLLTAVLALALTACGQGTGSPSEDASPPKPEESTAQPAPETQKSAPPFSLAVYPDHTLHPVLAENRTNLSLAPLLYEAMFVLDNTFTPKGVLCSGWTCNEAATQWVFALHSGITFSDGTPLTGELVAQALNLALQPGSQYRDRLSSVSRITGEGNQVTITLWQPNGNLPALLDIPIALDGDTRPLGTGPYTLSGERSNMVLTARSGWWRGGEGALPIDEIPLTPIYQTDDLIVNFDAGNITLLDVDLMGTNALGYSGSYEVWEYPTTTMVYLGVNTAKRGLGQNAAYRTALSHAADRETIAGSVYANHAVASALPVHPDSPLYAAAAAVAPKYNIALAMEEVAALTLPAAPLVLLVNSENTTKVAAAQRIATQLTAVGLTVEVSKLPWEDFLAALGKGNFDLYLGEVPLTADFDLTALLSSGGALNYGKYSSTAANTLLAQFRAATGLSRNTAAQALYTHLAEESPIIPLCFKNGSVLTQWGRISGLSPVLRNSFYNLENWTIY